MKYLKISLFAALFVALSFVAPRLSGQTMAVIANKSVSAGSIDASTLANIVTLDQKQFGGASVVLFDLGEDGGAKSKFYSFIGKSFTDCKKVWLKAKLTGNGNPPATIASEDEMVKKVASTPGAIGYVSVGKVTGDVKVLAKQ